jgi:uncharacterized membrane protein
MAASSGKYIALVFGGWSAFAGSHMYLSHPGNREYYIEKWGGENKFQGIYSIIALSIFVPTTLVYALKTRGAGTIVHKLGYSSLVQFVASGLKGLGIMGLAQRLVNPAPMSPQANQTVQTQTSKSEPTGIMRITRHPSFASLSLIALGNCLARGNLGDLVFWAGFPIFYIIGGMHQDYRLKKVKPAAFYEKTSILPIKAIIEGRNSLQDAIHEMSPKAAIVGAGVATGIFMLRFTPLRPLTTVPLPPLTPK